VVWRQGPKEIGDVDTDDEKDEEAQYEQWKGREMARIRCAQQPSLFLQRDWFSHLFQHWAVLWQIHRILEIPCVLNWHKLGIGKHSIAVSMPTSPAISKTSFNLLWVAAPEMPVAVADETGRRGNGSEER
jgi:hypothetical protein